jgi:hypothetical protein
MKCSKQLSVTVPWTEHSFREVFSIESGQSLFEDCVQVVPPQVAHMKENMEKVSKIVNKDQ